MEGINIPLVDYIKGKNCKHFEPLIIIHRLYIESTCSVIESCLSYNASKLFYV